MKNKFPRPKIGVKCLKMFWTELYGHLSCNNILLCCNCCKVSSTITKLHPALTKNLCISSTRHILRPPSLVFIILLDLLVSFHLILLSILRLLRTRPNTCSGFCTINPSISLWVALYTGLTSKELYYGSKCTFVARFATTLQRILLHIFWNCNSELELVYKICYVTKIYFIVIYNCGPL